MEMYTYFHKYGVLVEAVTTVGWFIFILKKIIIEPPIFIKKIKPANTIDGFQIF